jgi:tight adherence protein B
MAVSAVVVGVCPPAAVMLLRRRAEGQFEAALPGALRSIAADVRAGATVRAAIERLALTPSPVAADFDRVRRRLELGAGLAGAVEPWIVDRPSSSVRVVVGALSCTDEVGGSAATALDGVAASLSDRLAVAAEARAQSAQARVSAIVVGAAPLGYLAFAAASDRDAISDLISRPIGRMCVTGAVLLDVLAVVWMRRIVRTPEPS